MPRMELAASRESRTKRMKSSGCSCSGTPNPQSRTLIWTHDLPGISGFPITGERDPAALVAPQAEQPGKDEGSKGQGRRIFGLKEQDCC